MLAYQPDIVQQQILVRVAELQLLLARNQLLPQLNLNALYQLNGLGPHLDNALGVQDGHAAQGDRPAGRGLQRAAGLNANPGLFNDFQSWQVGLTYHRPARLPQRPGQHQAVPVSLLRQRAFLQQVVHQTTHSLARFFLEVDANFKQFKTAQRLRQAAQIRLESARAYYEEGRTGFTIDRLLDAVSQYADAIAQEAQYKTSYNTSIAALEEAKGTLWPTTTSPSTRARARGRPTSRPATSRPRTVSSRSRTTATCTRTRSPATACPTRSRPRHRPTPAADAGPRPSSRPRSGPIGPPPTPVPPAYPTGETTPISDNASSRRCRPTARSPRPPPRPRRPCGGGGRKPSRSTSTYRRCPSDAGREARILDRPADREPSRLGGRSLAASERRGGPRSRNLVDRARRSNGDHLGPRGRDAGRRGRRAIGGRRESRRSIRRGDAMEGCNGARGGNRRRILQGDGRRGRARLAAAPTDSSRPRPRPSRPCRRSRWARPARR